MYFQLYGRYQLQKFIGYSIEITAIKGEGNRIHPLLSTVKSLNPFQVQINQYRYSRSIIRRRSIQKPEFFRILKIYLIKTSIKNVSEHAGILSPFMELPLSISKNPSARQIDYGWKQVFAF